MINNEDMNRQEGFEKRIKELEIEKANAEIIDKIISGQNIDGVQTNGINVGQQSFVAKQARVWHLARRRSSNMTGRRSRGQCGLGDRARADLQAGCLTPPFARMTYPATDKIDTITTCRLSPAVLKHREYPRRSFLNSS